LTLSIEIFKKFTRKIKEDTCELCDIQGLCGSEDPSQGLLGHDTA